MHKIWFNKPARHWQEALPIGNGFTGVMIYGTNKTEKLCFNDGTLWSGYPKDYNSEKSLQNLSKVRELIFAGKNKEERIHLGLFPVNSLFFCVELEGFEPSSKRGNSKLSTCLSSPLVFVHEQDRSHPLIP